MKLVTWNINSIRMRLERLLGWIDRNEPDLLCLQETKVPDDLFPRAPLEERGYQVALHGQKGYNGVAILSRLPLEAVRCGMDDGEEDGQARLIAADVAGMRLVCAYVPNGQAPGTEKYAHKLRWMERLRAHLAPAIQKRPVAPLVLCGDFNVAPEDRDVHDPAAWEGKIHCSEPERAALRAIAALGLDDAFRAVRPEPGLYSWWDYRMLAFPKGRGLRIDHVLATAPVMARVTSAHIDRDERKGKQPSDHAPVVVELV